MKLSSVISYVEFLDNKILFQELPVLLWNFALIRILFYDLTTLLNQRLFADVMAFSCASSRALRFFQMVETVDCDNPNFLQIEAFFLPLFNALTTATLPFTDNAIFFNLSALAM
ncbi:hypothetical protein T4D_1092 [Trichinella pseudospiralis]|uniref:Uncharacterized protein n=1 Tax=Trichinella pseudospiralis TaxID=6337 RepID=A0A0V1FXV2_TRIPS|nr:hypothetical protein T4D_1092 [Trichinella pseudospiralis]